MTLPTPVVLHGHFYQPPREDPWLDRIDDEPTAAPFPNWNERITAECYEPLVTSGAFEWMSFDLGPTLARWLEAEHPRVHDGIVEGDRLSRTRLGYGNALAQPYHHIILPLATEKERATEIRWGLADFERRFGRPAEGMWLPETAVDSATLQSLADAGVGFTVLSPRQVRSAPPGGIGTVSLAGGRSIAVCVYDDALSHSVAFGELLGDPGVWVERIETMRGEDDALVSIATDGETFGHHHEGADETLASVITRLRETPDFAIENFASVIARRSELPEVALVEPSAWSCEHGVDRWQADCGCKMAPEKPSHQRWRGPLRTALQTLAAGVDELLATSGPRALSDPERAIQGLGEALGRGTESIEEYAKRESRTEDAEAASVVLALLRDRHAMFTSCGWFFDDVAGIEARQVLRYAAHAIDLVANVSEDRAAELEASLLDALATAESNDPDVGHGSNVLSAMLASRAV